MKTAFKIFSLILIVALAFGFSTARPVSAASILYVSTSGNDANDCLTTGTACATIQGAIDKAVGGESIQVEAGTYNVSTTILVNKAVTISGPVGGGAKVIGTGTDQFKVFSISSANVTLEYLEITLAVTPAYPLLVSDEANSSLVLVSGGTGMTGIVIRNNKIYVPAQTPPMGNWTGRAIVVTGSAVSGLVIDTNEIFNTRNGIVLQSNNSATISKNTIYNTKGGIMNYTGSQADADARVMTLNKWGTVHNEWDMVWNSGGGPYDLDENALVLLMSKANNDAYVLSLMPTAYTTPAQLLYGNRSHVFVNSTTGTTTIHNANGNINVPYAKIQDGNNAVVPGGKVIVAAGTYAEQVNITKPLSLLGAGKDGANATIISSSALGTVLLSSTGSASSPILLKDLQITGPYGIRTNTTPIDYVTLDNVWMNANPVKSGEGFRIVTPHQMTHLTITNSIIEGYIDGMIIEKNYTAPCNPDMSTKLQFVTVTDTIFRNNYRKGLYTETLSDATFTNVQLINNGFVNPGTNLAEYNSAGFDLNLKNGTYANLSFINMTATGNGLKAKDGAALMIKARDDGGTYSLCPATLNNVLISGGTFTGNERGIRFGEPGTSNAGPTGVSIFKAQVYGNVQTYTGTDGSAYGDVVNFAVASADSSPIWWGSESGPVPSQMYGTQTFIPWCTNAECTKFGGPVTNITQHLGYATIQAAIDEANTNDVLSVAAGTFVENVVVDVPVEIYGAGQTLTFVKPALSAANPCTGSSLCGGTASNVFLVQANDVKIHDLTIDGDNPGLTSGIVRGEADLDARNGIIKNSTGTFNNLEVYNTTVKNIYLRGIYSTGGTFNFHHNTVTNVQGDAYSIAMFAWYGPGTFANNTVSYANDGISANHSSGIQFLNNTVTYSGSGIHTDNSNDGGGVADLIQGNTVDCNGSAAGAHGIWTFVPYKAPTVNNNTITNCAVGLSAWGQGAAVVPQFTNNTVTGDSSSGSVGAYITTDLISWGYSDVSVYFEGNTISGFEYAVQLAGGQQSWNPYPFVAKTINATFFKNIIKDYTYSVNKDTGALAYNANFASNYWGSACGPSNISEGVTYSPWYTDEAMSTLVSGTTGDYTFAAGTSTATMNAVIACAAPNSTFTFLAGNHYGDIVIPAGRDNLRFVLNTGAKINANSPCFTVNADYITIEAEEYLGATCTPSAGSNGIEVVGARKNLSLSRFIIDGTNGANGIHFGGVMTDLVIADLLVHNNPANGILFDAAPAGTIDIHGNMFRDNTLKGIEAGTFAVQAEYNSWGSLAGPTAGDGISSGVDAIPWTHVDVSLLSSGSPWANQVVSGQTITYAVKANVWNANSADVTLKYPANLTYVSSSASGTFNEAEVLIHDGVARTVNFQAYSTTGNLTPTNPVTLFTVTFTAGATGSGLMDLDDLTDGFGMALVNSSSSNVYAYALTDGSVNVIELPTMDIVPTAPYIAGLPIPFTLNITNTNGGAYTALNLNFTKPSDALLEYKSGSTWVTVTNPFNLGALTAGGTLAPQFRVTFYTPGDNTLAVSLVDTLALPSPLELETATEDFTVAGNYSLLGTFSMQGRVFRGGVPVTLTWAGTPAYAPLGTTLNTISNNLSMTLTYGGVYTITTNQPRYLNVTADLGRTVTLSGAYTMAPLELKGGNAVWTDNIVDITDAGVIGGQWNSATPTNGDVNFDGKVNIQDLALVGGNWHVTSAMAYGTAAEPPTPWIP